MDQLPSGVDAPRAMFETQPTSPAAHEVTVVRYWQAVVLGVAFALVGATSAPPAVAAATGNDQPSTRIVNGDAIPITDAPWQVAITTTSGWQYCGGSIYNDSTIITAAHCAESTSASQTQIWAGVTNVSSNSVPRVQVSNVVLHPSYNTNTLDNDIALLWLATPPRPRWGQPSRSYGAEQWFHVANRRHPRACKRLGSYQFWW
jgi:hypothetical protein